LIVFLLLFLPVIIFAEIGDIEISNLTASVVYSELRIDAFNLDEPQSQPLIFSTIITNTTDSPISNYEIHISMTWRGNEILEDIIISPRETSSWASLPAGTPMTLTNRDILINSSADFVSETDVDLDEIREANKDFEEIVLQTGHIPDGLYAWSVQYFGENGEPLSEKVCILYEIISPISILLTSPGSPIGLEAYYSLSNRPTFVWYSNLGNYTLSLYPVASTIESPEDIEGITPLFTKDNINANILTFPEDVASLTPGSTYGWQVTAETFMPVGIASETKESQFYLFRVMTDSEQQSTEQAIINFFNQLNVANIDEMINLINSGYSLQNISWENSDITIDELMNLLSQVQDGTIIFKSFTIE
ncbi:MAG: hypothetical protein KAS49_08240, partial [Candidatus Cloacimonetes bacterium]|nr:hypothetical protein [Candidatus Cloacimonadota bacterium]